MSADVSQAKSGRFTAVVERHAAHVHDYCDALLTDRRDAANAARATLVIAYTLLDRLQDLGRVRPWLLALARYECRNANPVRAHVPGWSSAAPTIPDSRSRTETAQTASSALNALPAVEREVLDLVYRHYLSSADVAAVLGEPADRASALLASAVTSFERVTQERADGTRQRVPPQRTPGVLVAGVRAISAIPLIALPPSILADALSIVAAPEFASQRESFASTIGDLDPDGFPLPPRDVRPDPEREAPDRKPSIFDRALALSAVVQWAARQRMVLEIAGRITRRRLAVLAAVLVALAAAFAAMASSSPGVPNAISRAVGQALGQDPMGPSRVSLRRLPGPVPITALLPKKPDKGIVLPVLPAGPARGPTSSRKPPTGSSPPVASNPPSPTSTPTPSSPSPTPSSPSPTPSSASPTPTSPPPTPAAGP